MLINKALCNGCAKCVAECHNAAIKKDIEDNYYIDASVCTNCEDIFDIECIRVCPTDAITSNDGTVPEIDRTPRVRSEHLLWFMAVIGSMGRGQFPLGVGEWDAFRRIIAAAYLDPDIEVRLTKNFDDNCQGCPTKRASGHVELCGNLDDACFERLGVKPGAVMRLWDAVQLVEDKFSIPFIRGLGVMSEDVISCFVKFVAPDAKVLSNI